RTTSAQHVLFLADQPWSTIQASQESVKLATNSQSAQYNQTYHFLATVHEWDRSLATHALICDGKEYSAFLRPAAEGIRNEAGGNYGSVAAACARRLHRLDGTAHRGLLLAAWPARRGVGPDRPQRDSRDRGRRRPQPPFPQDPLAAAR